jgi:hypothetical protein
MSRRTSTIVIVTAVAALTAPLAIAKTRDPLREGVRNPTSGHATQETQVIADTPKNVYGTRQSNTGAGGGAIYGCRSVLDTTALGDPKKSTPCIRVNNLSSGKAFDFQAKTSRLIGIFQAGPSITTPRPDAAPFVTNATAVAVGLNADRVDSLNASDIVTQASNAAVKAIGGGASGTSGVCPTNTTLAGGGCIEDSARSPLSYADAAAACAQAGRRLVPPDVLLGARTLPGIDLGSGEMSANITAATLALSQGYATVSDTGTIAVQTLGSTSPFRCITA